MNKKELDAFICELLEIPALNSMIENQIAKFIKQYSYKEIARAVYFYLEVLGRPHKKEMGIGIVPHVMEDAKKYFYKLEIEEKNRKQQAEILKSSLDKEKKIIIARPKRDRTGINKIKIEDIV